MTLGGLQLLCYLLIANLSGQFLHGADFIQRPILEVLGLFGFAFLLYLASYRLVTLPSNIDRSTLPIVLFVALAFRMVQLFSNPIQEVDIYRYLWDGQVLASGTNPFAYSPQQVELAPRGTPDRRLLELQELSRSTPAIATLFDRVHFRSVPTVYPPVSQLVFALAATLTPADATLEIHLLVMKGILIAFDLGTIFVLVGILRHLNMPMALCLAYAWCPLVIKEFANSGHLDSIAVFLTTCSVSLMLRAAATDHRKKLTLDILAGLAWGLSILAKFYPIILGPLFVVCWWRRQRWHAVLPMLAAGTLIVGFQAAFRIDASSGHRELEGLGTFLTCWEMNDWAFACVIENLAPVDVSVPPPWFSVLPNAHRARLVETVQKVALLAFGWQLDSFDAAFLLARFLTSLLYGGISLYLALKPWPNGARQELGRRVFLTIAWFWFLIPTQNPWYWTWALPFIVFAPWPWRLVSGFALIYYFRFWLEYHVPEQMVWPTPYAGVSFFDYVIVWFEHVPVLALILVTTLLTLGSRPLGQGRD